MRSRPTPPRLLIAIGVAAALLIAACGGDDDSGDETTAISEPTQPDGTSTDDAEATVGPGVDITGAVFDDRDAACSAHSGAFIATVTDEATGSTYDATVELTSAGDTCTLTGNGIPNHDFDSSSFATAVGEVTESFQIPSPQAGATPTALSLRFDNGVFVNGVKLDVLAAACYGVGNEPLGKEKIGCFEEGTPWRYDPMHPENDFGTDGHNAHTQPDGAYHYHGDPLALYDTSGRSESGVIGFAADGFPIYGPFIDDDGTIRRVTSGYELKDGDRVSKEGEGAFPGGAYDGTFIDDYEFTGAGDLDACNGMTYEGSYGYYLTDSYPWVVGCFAGTPDDSFRKAP